MATAATVRVPIEARFALVDGKMEMVSAVYADVPVAAIAKLLYPLFESWQRDQAEEE